MRAALCCTGRQVFRAKHISWGGVRSVSCCSLHFGHHFADRHRTLDPKLPFKSTTLKRHLLWYPFTSMVSTKVKNFTIKGLSSAPVTPFKDNGDINFEIFPDYVQHFVDYGMPNAFVTGTTGEGQSMTLSERKQVAETWVKEAKGKLSSVTVHVGTGNLRDSQELARHAQSIGADAIACVGPSYYKPENLEQYVFYMRDVAAAAPEMPFYLYDIDFFTGIQYTADEFFKLADRHIPTLKGLKHTSANLVSMSNILLQHGDKYLIMMGTDEYYLEGLSLGLEITIGSTYLGHVLNRIRDAFNNGDLVEARNDQKRAVQVHNLRRKYNFTVPGFAKAMLRVHGLKVGNPRCPYGPVTDDVVQSLRRDLTGIGYFDWAANK